ncbi:MAG: hypothetical protein M3Q44_03445 [bacterium]|nr:hypothetical protein [bacterium]
MKAHSRYYLVFLVLVLFLVIGFFLRSYMFLSGDFYFLPDQGRDMLLVRDIIETKHIPLIGGHAGFGGLFHGPLWLFLIVPFYLISSGSPFYSLVPLYLGISFSMIIVGFIVTWRLYGLRAGILAAFLFTFSNEFISTLAFTSNAQVMPLLFLTYFYFIVRYLRGWKWGLVLAALSTGIGLHFEAAFAVFLVPLTVITILVWKRIPSIRIALGSLGALCLAVSNFIIFDLRHQFLLSQSLMKLLSGTVQGPEYAKKYEILSYRLVDRLDWLWRSFRIILWDYDSRLLQGILIGAFLLAGFYIYSHWRLAGTISRQAKEIGYFLIFLVILMAMYVIYKGELHAHYVQSLSALTIILFAWCLAILTLRRAGMLLVASFLFVELYGGLHYIQATYIPMKPYLTDSNGSYKNLVRLADWIYMDAPKEDFGYFVYDPPVVTYGMDYIMSWRGKTTYSRVAKNEKLPITYLIMNQPPTGDLNAHTFWIDTVLHTPASTILAEKEFVGKTIVHKIRPAQNEAPVDPNYFINLTFR